MTAGIQDSKSVEFATGQLLWEERSGVAPGSLCYADELLYVHGENGNIGLIEATPEAYRERGVFTPPDQPDRGRGGRAWTYRVLADGRLYIRDMSVLRCYDVRADGGHGGQ